MKYSIFSFLLAITLLCACGTRTPSEGDTNAPQDPTDTPTFTTPTAAAEQAKADLLRVLSQQADLNLGVDPASLEASRAAAPMPQQQLNFEALLSADSTTSIPDIAGESLPTVIPFASDRQLVTVAAVTPVEEGWQIAELAGASLTHDLNTVINATQASPENIRIIQVPNLQATIYAVNFDGYTSYHTRYGGLPIAEGLDDSYLVEILSRDARRFQELYGREVQQQRLVR